MFYNEILPDFFFCKCRPEPCFTAAPLALFRCESCPSESSFQATVCAPPGGMSVLYIRRVVPPRRMHYLSSRRSMSERVTHSQLTRRCQPHFASTQRPCFFPSCKSITRIVPGNLFYALSEDAFSHSSVITAYSQAIMCTTCVWKHLGVFSPIISAGDESHFQPSSSV